MASASCLHLERIAVEEVELTDENYPCRCTENRILMYYGNFSSHENIFELDGTEYHIYHREICEFIGSVRDPIKTLVKCCLIDKNHEHLQPDCIVLFKYIGRENILNFNTLNPQGIFMLKYELAFARECY
ncbi:MAG: hypothetical protein ACTSP4_10815 [Candidatus Hodarchaeales archaeon]